MNVKEEPFSDELPHFKQLVMELDPHAEIRDVNILYAHEAVCKYIQSVGRPMLRFECKRAARQISMSTGISIEIIWNHFSSAFPEVDELD